MSPSHWSSTNHAMASEIQLDIGFQLKRLS